MKEEQIKELMKKCSLILHRHEYSLSLEEYNGLYDLFNQALREQRNLIREEITSYEKEHTNYMTMMATKKDFQLGQVVRKICEYLLKSPSLNTKEDEKEA